MIRRAKKKDLRLFWCLARNIQKHIILWNRKRVETRELLLSLQLWWIDWENCPSTLRSRHPLLWPKLCAVELATSPMCVENEHGTSLDASDPFRSSLYSPSTSWLSLSLFHPSTLFLSYILLSSAHNERLKHKKKNTKRNPNPFHTPYE